MENTSCKICSSELKVEDACKLCNEPTRLFCQTCGIMAEKRAHPACMLIDVNKMMMNIHPE